MAKYMIFTQNDNGFSVRGPVDRAEVVEALEEAAQEGTTVYQDYPEFMGDQMVEAGICILEVKICKPKPVTVVTKYEF